MTKKQAWAVCSTGSLLGLILAIAGAYFVIQYFVQTENPIRGEYLIGVAFASMYSMLGWWPAAFAATKLGHSIPRGIRIAIYAGTALCTLVFAYSLVFGQ